MPRARASILSLIAFITGTIFSCSERACTVRANHAKWKHYNGIQFSGNKAVRKK